MDDARVRLLREVLAGTEWVGRTSAFAATMRRVTRVPSGLLVVGTPQDEPWHLTAHLADEARVSGVRELDPTLVRWSAPPDAPAHLATTLDRLTAARRGETVLVVAEEASPESLLERVHDARRLGATVLAVEGGDPELQSVAHDALTVPAAGLGVPGAGPPELAFDTVEHLISLAVGEPRPGRGLRERLARLLDVVSGPDRSDPEC